MADFCKQCSLEHFGEDFQELAGLSTPDDTAKGLFAIGICEGCGGSRFDHEGICQGNCIAKHGPDKGEYPGPGKSVAIPYSQIKDILEGKK